MNVVKTVQAWYPAFHLGCEPQAVRCELCIVEANGRTYLKTPFAMLDAYGDDIERAMRPGGGYYPDEASCMAYLKAEYPWWQRAAPIMLALFNARHHYGDLVGTSRVADKCGVSSVTDAVYKLARGHRTVGLKAVKDCVRRLGA